MNYMFQEEGGLHTPVSNVHYTLTEDTHAADEGGKDRRGNSSRETVGPNEARTDR